MLTKNSIAGITLGLILSLNAQATEIEQEAFNKLQEHQIKLMDDEKENCQTQLVGADEEVKLLMTAAQIKKLKYLALQNEIEFEFERKSCKNYKCFKFKVVGKVKIADKKVKIEKKEIIVEKQDSIEKAEQIDVPAKERKDSDPLVKIYDLQSGLQAEVVCKDSQKLSLTAD